MILLFDIGCGHSCRIAVPFLYPIEFHRGKLEIFHGNSVGFHVKCSVDFSCK